MTTPGIRDIDTWIFWNHAKIPQAARLILYADDLCVFSQKIYRPGIVETITIVFDIYGLETSTNDRMISRSA